MATQSLAKSPNFPRQKDSSRWKVASEDLSKAGQEGVLGSPKPGAQGSVQRVLLGGAPLVRWLIRGSFSVGLRCGVLFVVRKEASQQLL